MSQHDPSRRQFLRGCGLATATVAASGFFDTGCAGMPRVGKRATAQPCDHRFCRYYKATSAGGRCSLAIRVAGGRP